MKIKKNKRILSLIVAIVMIFSSTIIAFGDSDNDSMEKIARENNFSIVDVNGKQEPAGLTYNGHGEYKVLKSTVLSDSNSNGLRLLGKKIDNDVIDVTDASMLNTDADYNKLVRVNSETYLRMKEIKLNPYDTGQVELCIEKYGVSNEVAKDIKAYCESAQNEPGKKEKVLTIYTSNFPREKLSVGKKGARNALSLSPQSSYYYVGYNNAKYKDEIWYGTNSPTYSNIRTGYTVKDYFDDSLNNFCNFAVGGAADYASSGAYSLLQIFANSPILTYPSASGDIWQAALNEAKWRKYTSIELYDSVTKKYVYSCRAISDRSRAYFSHYLYNATKQVKQYRDDASVDYACKNYYNLDRYAYTYMYDMAYTERIEKYSVNKWTNFTSQQ